MHAAIAQVLEHRALSKAGLLFHVSDWDIIADLPSTMVKLKEVFDSDDYRANEGTQSVVEICLARITSAIRETKTMEAHAASLVDLLDNCLSGGPLSGDAPQSKIASDLLSCLFLYSPSIVKSVINGNYCVLRVLPQLYCENAGPVHAHAAALVAALPRCEPAEKLSLLQLCSHIANANPEVLVEHVDLMDECLKSSQTRTAALHTLLTLVTGGRAAALRDRLPALGQANKLVLENGASESVSGASALFKVVAAIGCTSQKCAGAAMEILTLHSINEPKPRESDNSCGKNVIGAKISPLLLKEIEHIAEVWPNVVKGHMQAVRGLVNQGDPLTGGALARISALCSDDEAKRDSWRGLSSSEQITRRAAGGSRSRATPCCSDDADSGLSVRAGDADRDTNCDGASLGRQHVQLQGGRLPHAARRRSASSGHIANRHSISSLGNERSAAPPANNMSTTPARPLYATMMPRTSTGDASNGRRRGRQLTSPEGNSASGAVIRALYTPATARRYVSRPLSSNATSRASYGAAYETTSMGRSPGLTRAACGRNCTYFSRNPSSTASNSAKRAQASINITLQYTSNGRVAMRPSSSRPSVLLPQAAAENAHNEQIPGEQVGAAATSDRLKAMLNHDGGNNNKNEMNGALPRYTVPSPNTGSVLITTFGDNGVFTTSANHNTSPPPAVAQSPQHGGTLTQQHHQRRDASTELIREMSGGRRDLRLASVRGSNPIGRKGARKTPGGGRQPCTVSASSGAALLRQAHAARALLNSDNGNAFTPIQPSPVDCVKQFCDKHHEKIRDYIIALTYRFAVPFQCTVEDYGRRKRRMRVHFACQQHGAQCLYDPRQGSFISFKTKLPHLWLHLMFLHLQAHEEGGALGQGERRVANLRQCWQCLPKDVTKNKPFAALLTGAFPNDKEQQLLKRELKRHGFYQVFTLSTRRDAQWGCFACHSPEEMHSMVAEQGHRPALLQARLKEKRRGWWLFGRWRTKYFTLSGATLICNESQEQGQSKHGHSADVSAGANASLPSCNIDLRSIRQVRSIGPSGMRSPFMALRRQRGQVRQAFEIFTEDRRSYVLKAKQGPDADEWFKLLQIAVAQVQKQHNGGNISSTLDDSISGAATFTSKL